MALQQTSVDQVITGLNNREDFPQAHIQDLAADIAVNGLAFPPIYRKLSDGRIQCVAGECRTRAVRWIYDHLGDYYGVWGLDRRLISVVDTLPAFITADRTITADVRDLSDSEALRLMYTENNKRKDTNPIENAKFYARYGQEIGATDKHGDLIASKIADSLQVNPDLVRRRLSLLVLNEQYQDLLIKGIITLTIAEALAKLDVNRQRLCYQAWLSVKELERTPNKLIDLADHYKAAQDKEIADAAQGNLFGDLALFTGEPIRYSWEDLKTQIGLTENEQTTSRKALLEKVNALETELKTVKQQVVRNVRRERANHAAEMRKLAAENARLQALLNEWKNQTQQKAG